MSKTALLTIVIIIIVLGGGFMWWNSASAPAVAENPMTDAVAPTPQPQETTVTTPEPTASTSVSSASAPMAATVTYDGSKFSPATITVAQGATITFTDTAGSMWLASDPHPAHTKYDDTSRSEHCAAGYTGEKPFDQCAVGSTYSFTFTKAGTFSYHDHRNGEAHGTVTVVAAQ